MGGFDHQTSVELAVQYIPFCVFDKTERFCEMDIVSGDEAECETLVTAGTRATPARSMQPDTY